MKKLLNKTHLSLFLPLTIIMIISFFCMYQAKFIKDIYNYHLLKQILWFFLGFILLFLLSKIKIKFFFNYSLYLYLLGIISLILVLFFGKTTNGAKAWFNFGFFTIQPSEFVKIALLLYLTKITNNFKIRKTNEFIYLLKCFLITLIPSILVFFEPDTGAIIFYFLILLSNLILSGIKKYWFILSFFLLLLFSSTFIYLYLFNQDLLINLIGTSFFYRLDRLINFKNGQGLQLNNAIITLGNAKLFGNYIKPNILYVPEFPTDFVFTLSISIFGFLGGFIILLCYFILNFYFIYQLFKVKQLEYKLFIHGFIYIFIYQQFQNIFMNLGLMPIMGIPLAFLSYGGSNMIVYFIFIGFILNMQK